MSRAYYNSNNNNNNNNNDNTPIIIVINSIIIAKLAKGGPCRETSGVYTILSLTSVQRVMG